MTSVKLVIAIQLMALKFCFAQATDDHLAIHGLIEEYSRSVIARDSSAFYALFNDAPVTWCASLKDKSIAKEAETKGLKRRSYFSGSYKGFMRSLFRYESTEDKFDNIWIVEDGTVASVMMDYSFWGNKKMTNWGNKYLTMIKRDGKWKITSVIYSLELTEYYSQPGLEERKMLRNLYK